MFAALSVVACGGGDVTVKNPDDADNRAAEKADHAAEKAADKADEAADKADRAADKADDAAH